MIDNPIVTVEYKGPAAHRIRDEFPEKFLKDPQVYIKGYKYEKDRIRESVERNADLDYMPNQTVAHYQFRERQLDKEIQPDMRFTAKTALERIQQLLKDHTQSQVENQDFSKIKQKKLKNENIKSLSEKKTAQEINKMQAQLLAKQLLPSLHNKTHFKAAQVLYNNMPLCLSDKLTQSNPNLGKNQQINEIQFQEESPVKTTQKTAKEDQQQQKRYQSLEEYKEKLKEDQKNDQMEAFNPIETSKQILLLCNVIKKKSNKVKTQKIGEGHLISTLDKTINEVYKDLYHKEIKLPKIHA